MATEGTMARQDSTLVAISRVLSRASAVTLTQSVLSSLPTPKLTKYFLNYSEKAQVSPKVREDHPSKHHEVSGLDFRSDRLCGHYQEDKSPGKDRIVVMCTQYW